MAEGVLRCGWWLERQFGLEGWSRKQGPWSWLKLSSGGGCGLWLGVWFGLEGRFRE